MGPIKYVAGNALALDAVLEVYRDSGLGERRPTDDTDRFTAMLRNANLVVTAWDGEEMVGIARSITDWVYVTYLADLAVKKSHQRQGIGKELIRFTKAATDPKRCCYSSPRPPPLITTRTSASNITHKRGCWTRNRSGRESRIECH